MPTARRNCTSLRRVWRRLLRPSDGGTLGALDFRSTGVTLINSMQRRVGGLSQPAARSVSAPRRSQVASIHDQVRAKEGGLERFLRYDRWPRNSFRLLLFAPEKTFEDYWELRLDEHARWPAAPTRSATTARNASAWNCERSSAKVLPRTGPEELRCTKNFTFAHEDAGYRVACASELSLPESPPFAAQIGIEMVLNFLAPDAPDRYFEVPRGRHPLRWAAAVPVAGVASPATCVWWTNGRTSPRPSKRRRPLIFGSAPIETVSESEEGFERVYQGSQILMVWPVELAPGARLARGSRLELSRLARWKSKTTVDPVDPPRFSVAIRSSLTPQSTNVCANGHSWSTHCASRAKAAAPPHLHDLCASVLVRAFRPDGFALFEVDYGIPPLESRHLWRAARRRCISMRRSVCVVASQVTERPKVEIRRPARG